MSGMRHIVDRLKETKVLQNYSYMSLLSVLNALIGVLIYPYLIRVMGAESMGTYAFLLGIAMYFQTLVEFGFDMPSVKAVSLSSGNAGELNRIVSLVYVSKLIMFVVAVLVAIPIVLLTPILWRSKWLFVVIFAQVAYTVLFPQWYYQGMKNMRFATILQFIIRLSQIPLILLLVHDDDDLFVYAMIVSATMLLGGLIGMFNLRLEGRQWTHVSMSDLRSMYRDAMPFFLTSISATIKERTLTTLIGVFLGMREVAIYDLAMKVVQIPRMLVNSINAALFPEVVGHATPERVRKILGYERWIGLAAMAGIAVLGYPLVWLLGGEDMLAAYPVAMVLSMTVYTFLVVGAYLQFVYIARGHYRVVAINQVVAMLTCLSLCGVGLCIAPSAWIVAASLSLSGMVEIVFCRICLRKI